MRRVDSNRMSYRFRCFAAAAACLIATSTAACNSGSHDGMEQVTVGQLSELMAGDDAPVVIDANSSGVRGEYGTIPGAVLLSSYGKYDIAAELPGDTATPLVFYCSSERCSAAPKAAVRATDAGYTDVRVLPEGIKGWVQAGKPVENAAPSS